MTITPKAKEALQHICSMPTITHTTLNRKDTQSLLLHTDGETLHNGRRYGVVAKHLAAGVYSVRLASYGRSL